jgi:hypothetical protein
MSNIEEKYKESREAPLYKATERLLWEVDDTLNYLCKDRRHTLGQHMLQIVLGMLDCISIAYDFPEQRVKHKEDNIEKFAQRYNSYMGYLIHKKSYAIRWDIWNEVADEAKQYVYMTNGLAVMKVRNRYKERNKLIECYGKKHRKQKRVCRDSSCIYPQ